MSYVHSVQFQKYFIEDVIDLDDLHSYKHSNLAVQRFHSRFQKYFHLKWSCRTQVQSVSVDKVCAGGFLVNRGAHSDWWNDHETTLVKIYQSVFFLSKSKEYLLVCSKR